jgi:hypothetical protein
LDEGYQKAAGLDLSRRWAADRDLFVTANEMNEMHFLLMFQANLRNTYLKRP